VVLVDDGQLMAVARSDYDYERQMFVSAMHMFRGEGGTWARYHARRVLRGFPVQAVAALLRRSGFSTVNILTATLERYEAESTRAPRVIFVAHKQDNPS
jgi:hypothetical protein